jgi:hypothetical protein
LSCADPASSHLCWVRARARGSPAPTVFCHWAQGGTHPTSSTGRTADPIRASSELVQAGRKPAPDCPKDEAECANHRALAAARVCSWVPRSDVNGPVASMPTNPTSSSDGSRAVATAFSCTRNCKRKAFVVLRTRSIAICRPWGRPLPLLAHADHDREQPRWPLWSSPPPWSTSQPKRRAFLFLRKLNELDEKEQEQLRLIRAASPRVEQARPAGLCLPAHAARTNRRGSGELA